MHHRTDNPTARKLLRAFMQFNRVEWHQRLIAGCTLSEIRVLFCLRRGATANAFDMKVSEISKSLHVTSPTITQIIKGLEAKGLVERASDPIDRRAVGVALTEKGDAVTQMAREAFLSRFEGLIEHLGEESSEQLAALLSEAFHYFSERAASENQSLWNGDEAHAEVIPAP
jgi:DNA-binding MarR family transcriptional regulator